MHPLQGGESRSSPSEVSIKTAAIKWASWLTMPGQVPDETDAVGIYPWNQPDSRQVKPKLVLMGLCNPLPRQGEALWTAIIGRH